MERCGDEDFWFRPIVPYLLMIFDFENQELHPWGGGMGTDYSDSIWWYLESAPSTFFLIKMESSSRILYILQTKAVKEYKLMMWILFFEKNRQLNEQSTVKYG
jgi:hypothetical protein